MTYRYTGCECSTAKAELTGGDPRLTVHCIRLNDYRSFGDATAAGPNLDPKMAESYQSVHGGIPQYTFDSLRNDSCPTGYPQVQRRMSGKARAPEAKAWAAAYEQARRSGKGIVDSVNESDSKLDPAMLAGGGRKKASTTDPAAPRPVDPSTGLPVEEAPRHHAARFIGYAERAKESTEKLKGVLQELHRLNVSNPALFSEVADMVLDADECVGTLGRVVDALTKLPSELKTEAPKIEAAPGGWVLVREKFRTEIADQLGCDPEPLAEMRLLIITVSGPTMIAIDPEFPANKAFGPSLAFQVISEPTPEGVAQATEARAIKRARRA